MKLYKQKQGADDSSFSYNQIDGITCCVQTLAKNISIVDAYIQRGYPDLGDVDTLPVKEAWEYVLLMLCVTYPHITQTITALRPDIGVTE